MRPGPSAQDPTGPTPRGDDLAWDAFRYVDGVMTPAEAARFDGRLLDDQAACAAVAAAVEMIGALALIAAESSAPPSLVHTMPSGRRLARRFALPASLSTAAALFLTAGWWWGALAPPPTATDVGLAWAGLRVAEAPAGDGAGDPAEPTQEGGDDDAATETDIDDVPAERPVPPWMVAVIASTAGPESTTEADIGVDETETETDADADAETQAGVR